VFTIELDKRVTSRTCVPRLR